MLKPRYAEEGRPGGVSARTLAALGINDNERRVLLDVDLEFPEQGLTGRVTIDTPYGPKAVYLFRDVVIDAPAGLASLVGRHASWARQAIREAGWTATFLALTDVEALGPFLPATCPGGGAPFKGFARRRIGRQR